MKAKRSRSWRKITVEVNGSEDEFRWRYGRGTIEVRWGREVILREAAHKLRGTTPDLYERGQWKRTSDGIVTPAMVRNAIRKQLGIPTVDTRKRIHLWAGSTGGGC